MYWRWLFLNLLPKATKISNQAFWLFFGTGIWFEVNLKISLFSIWFEVNLKMSLFSIWFEINLKISLFSIWFEVNLKMSLFSIWFEVNLKISLFSIWFEINLKISLFSIWFEINLKISLFSIWFEVNLKISVNWFFFFLIGTQPAKKKSLDYSTDPNVVNNKQEEDDIAQAIQLSLQTAKTTTSTGASSSLYG